MINNRLKLILLAGFSLLQLVAFGQSPVEMADNFRGEGKIYVVVMVIFTLLAGIFWTLFRFYRKLKELEK